MICWADVLHEMGKWKQAILYFPIKSGWCHIWMVSGIEIVSWNIKANSPVVRVFVPRQMGKPKTWLNGKGWSNNQTAIFVWLVVAKLLLLPSVKVSYADGEQLATRVPAVSRELVAAAQLQLTGGSRVVILISCCSPGRPLVVLICAIPGGRIGEGEGKHLALIRWIHKPSSSSSISIESIHPYSIMRARSVHFSFSSLSSLSMNTPGLTKYNWWQEKNILMNDWSTIIIIIIYTANKWFAPSSPSPSLSTIILMTNISILTNSTNHVRIIVIKRNPNNTITDGGVAPQCSNVAM